MEVQKKNHCLEMLSSCGVFERKGNVVVKRKKSEWKFPSF